MSKAQQEIQSVFGAIPVAEALANPTLVLADGSSSSPNLRSLEMVLTAIFVSRYTGEVVTNFYHGSSFRETADNTCLWLRKMGFKLDRGLLELHFNRYFGDPQLRIDNIAQKMRSKGKSEESIQRRIDSFVCNLPVSVFSKDGKSLVDLIQTTREETTEFISNQLDLQKQGSFIVEKASEMFGSITPNDVISNTDSEFLARYPVMKICCPECSLSNEDEPIEHGVSADGQIFQSVGGVSTNGKIAQNCSFIKNLNEFLSGQTVLDLPVRELINMGFKISGKLIYLLETFLYKNPNITQAVRAYSNPNGTISKAASTYEGLTILTPPLYIYVCDNGEMRDANIFELMEFIADGEGLLLLKEFVSQIPLVDDGVKRVLDISSKQILVTEL